MSRIPSSFIDDVLNRLDIVDVVDHRVKLKRSGKNYMACCPFHQEKTPSFTVSPDKQFYYCFGCGASGNALGFIMEFDHTAFTDAVESAAKILGLTVPYEDTHPSKAPKKESNLYTLLEKASQFYKQQLREHPDRKTALTYLQTRGLTTEICALFGIGYAAAGWDNLLKALGPNEQAQKQLLDAGLITENEDKTRKYDRFRQRIMFPILDVRGRTIGFGGRILGSETTTAPDGSKIKVGGPKYLNSPETEVFHKGRELYGLYQARMSNRHLQRLLVVEGYMDVIALAQFDISYAVATLGTACGADHLHLAFKYCSEIVFCFDGDNAGRTAARRALENTLPSMSDGRQVKFLFLPEGQDPDSLVRQIGKERFEQQIEQATALEDYFFRNLAEGLNMNSMEGRARFSKLAAPQLHQLPPGVYRELMFQQLSRHTGLSLDILQDLIHTPATPESATSNLHVTPQINTPINTSPARTTAAINVIGLSNSPPPNSASNLPVAQRPGFQTIKITPARMATMLLLEHPELVKTLDSQWRADPAAQDEHLLEQLIKSINQYQLQSFHSIMGFWAGEFGVEAQKELTQLVSNQFLGAVKRLSPFDAQQELSDAFNKLRIHTQQRQYQSELTQLQAIPLSALDDAQKNRLRELLKMKLLTRK
ncbi:MAG TPA: DNA primase [Cellvibrionaceae bacterium]